MQAQGYARASGRVGACIATSGPGATNLVTGVADAMIDSTPIVCVTGQVPKHLLGSDAFQETDVMGITIPVTKWSFQVTEASEIPEVFAKAFYVAKSGRPRPGCDRHHQKRAIWVSWILLMKNANESRHTSLVLSLMNRKSKKPLS